MTVSIFSFLLLTLPNDLTSLTSIFPPHTSGLKEQLNQTKEHADQYKQMALVNEENLSKQSNVIDDLLSTKNELTLFLDKGSFEFGNLYFLAANTHILIPTIYNHSNYLTLTLTPTISHSPPLSHTHSHYLTLTPIISHSSPLSHTYSHYLTFTPIIAQLSPHSQL